MEKEEEKEEERGYGRKDVLPIVDGEGSSVSEVISSLIEGESVFQSYGTAKVKVGNKVKHLPIKSVDMEKIVKTLANKRPKPPTDRVMIRANSKEGREAGLKRDRWVEVALETDEAYQERLQDYNAELGYLVILYGLNCRLETKNKVVVWEPDNPNRQNKEEALRVLRNMGLTGWQFTQISDAIRDLTKFADEEMEKNLEEE